MKVTGQKPHAPSDLSTGKSREADQRAAKVRESRTGAQRPQDSHTSLTLSKLKEAIRNTPDVRGERVQALQEKIRSGDYKVNAERLATNLITESLREELE